VKTFAREGFTALANLSEEDLRELAKLIPEKFATSAGPDVEELKERLRLPARKASALAIVAAFATAAVTSGEDPSKAIAVGLEARILSADASIAFQRLIEQLKPQGPLIKETIKSQELASEVLPSFERLSTALDLRFRFEGGKISATVPVVVAHLRTDSRESQAWFQLQKQDLVHLLAQFEKLLREIDEAERWASH
jgi:hypothetical protein